MSYWNLQRTFCYILQHDIGCLTSIIFQCCLGWQLHSLNFNVVGVVRYFCIADIICALWCTQHTNVILFNFKCISHHHCNFTNNSRDDMRARCYFPMKNHDVRRHWASVQKRQRWFIYCHRNSWTWLVCGSGIFKYEFATDLYLNYVLVSWVLKWLS